MNNLESFQPEKSKSNLIKKIGKNILRDALIIGLSASITYFALNCAYKKGFEQGSVSTLEYKSYSEPIQTSPRVLEI